VDPNLARAIAADAGVGRDDRVVEVGAGFGSVTLALAATGAHVLAVEFDRAVAPALREVVADVDRVSVVVGDALALDWGAVLGRARWTMASNLPYNIAVPLLMRMLEEAPRVSPYVVVVQRELAERLGAVPGSPSYGGVSVKLAFHADVQTLRRVPREVFWPRPSIDSSVVRLTPRRPGLDVDVDRGPLFAVIDAAFAERRKTMANALRRLGAGQPTVRRVLSDAGVEPSSRPEELGVAAFARLTSALIGAGVIEGP
jgi:16S rRNA (adenine1518-N6/adenine1519-N6)-dimethyltransferase